MDHFDYRDGELHCDGVRAEDLADVYGTPLYVYCERTLLHHLRVLREAFARAERPPLICYSVKANSNLTLLDILRREGAGFDVVSGGELQRVLEVGGDPAKTVYAGVGKTPREIETALEQRILLFNVESESELERIGSRARQRGQVASVAIRLNPDVDPRTHRYITTGTRENKFGVDLARAARILDAARDLPGIDCTGLHLHIGSQITDTVPYVAAIRKVLEYFDRAGGASIQWLDIGGGFGIHYRGEEALPATAFADAILPELRGRGLRLILEPGRFIVGNAGIILTRVITLKRSGGRRFAICDAGMNDLLRPALYGSYHRIATVRGERPTADAAALTDTDVVGPICESGDFLGLDRNLSVTEGSLLAIFSAGAYGFSMASNYNTRPRAAEVLVTGTEHRVIRRRENYDDLVRLERAP